jgi:hypothetical protein
LFPSAPSKRVFGVSVGEARAPAGSSERDAEALLDNVIAAVGVDDIADVFDAASVISDASEAGDVPNKPGTAVAAPAKPARPARAESKEGGSLVLDEMFSVENMAAWMTETEAQTGQRPAAASAAPLAAPALLPAQSTGDAGLGSEEKELKDDDEDGARAAALMPSNAASQWWVIY